MTDESASTTITGFLAGLDTSVRSRLFSGLQLVPLRFGQRLYDVHERMHHVYFPVSGSLTVMASMTNGSCSEIASIGSDGCYGYPSCGEVEASPFRVLVQTKGEAYRIYLNS
jgi:hypothetical protein